MRITEELKQSLESSLPKSMTTRQKLVAYKEHGNLTWDQVAMLCGRGRVSVERFSKDKYEQTADSDLLIRRDLETMFERYPLAITQATRGELYQTENVATLRKWFSFCHANSAMALIYGPPGSQKTFVTRRMVEDFNAAHLQLDDNERAFYIRSSARMGPRELLRRICFTTGAPGGMTTASCLNGLRLALRPHRVLLAVDEAQLLSLDALEALRELHDPETGLRVGVLLMGSHRLATILNQQAPILEQLNSRIEANVELSGVSAASAMSIVQAEMPNLSQRQRQALVDHSSVPDIYRHGTPYINVRRLFKAMNSTRAELAQKGSVQ
ncbi:AAA family ATPase [Terriglobus sp. RCC_193]|uniref:AAA family ATPase n=1 Tax=Terriglobus sp. RCC_193 TaxID=3239218 RepID=UPI00352408D5